LLQIHYSAPESTIKPLELAKHVGYPNYSAVNLQYGLLAKRVCNVLNLQLRFHIQALIIFVHPDSDRGESPKWIMRPQVVQALHELAWFDKTPPLTILEEIEQCKETYEALEITSRAAVIQSRIGQGLFRARLIDYWGGCAISGCKQLELLKASHIKPWRVSNNVIIDPENWTTC